MVLIDPSSRSETVACEAMHLRDRLLHNGPHQSQGVRVSPLGTSACMYIDDGKFAVP